MGREMRSGARRDRYQVSENKIGSGIDPGVLYMVQTTGEGVAAEYIAIFGCFGLLIT